MRRLAGLGACAVATLVLLVGACPCEAKAAYLEPQPIELSPSPETYGGAPTLNCSEVCQAQNSHKAAGAPGCGGAGNSCCCQAVAGPPRYFGCCGTPDLWCHFFDFVPAGQPGSCPQPSLCLPVPKECGKEGGPCCPPPTDLGADFSCGSGLVCQSPNVSASYQSFLELQGGRANHLDPGSYGKCVPAVSKAQGP